MRVLERDHILAALTAFAADCSNGEGRLVLVSGEAGVGKTTVLDEFREHGPERRWLRGACDDLSTPRPLGPLFDIAAQAGGALGDACRGNAPREALLAALLDELSRPDELPVVAFEDIHWADESTLDLLRFLAGRLEDRPVLLLITYRDDAVDGNARLQMLLGDLARQRATRRIEIPPLSKRAVALLAEGSKLDVDEIYRLSGGNPFFVTELMQVPVGELPPSARDAVLARIGRLSDAAREVLTAAALIGATVEASLLDAVARPAAASIDEIMGSGVVASAGNALRFRHEIARLAVERAVPPHRRLRTHQRILDVLRRQGCTDDARLAHHAELAEDRAEVLRSAPAAARRAAALASHTEAVAQYQRALRFSDAAAPEVVAALYDALAVELAVMDRWDEAATAEERALALWRELENPLREGDTLRRRFRTMWRLCRGEESVEVVRRSIELLEPLGPTPELAWAYAMRAVSGADHDLRSQACAQAVDLAERLDLPDVLSYSLNTEACSRFTLGDDWEGLMLRSLRVAIDAKAHDEAGRAYSNLLEHYLAALRFRDAESIWHDSHAYCDLHDLGTYLKCLTASQIQLLEVGGRWDECLSIGQAHLARPASPVNRLVPLTTVGTVLARRGDAAAAWPFFDQAIASALSGDDPECIMFVRFARIEAHWLVGRREEAVDDLATLIEFLDDTDAFGRGQFSAWVRRLDAELPTPTGTLAEPYALSLRGDHVGASEFWTKAGAPYQSALALYDAGTEPELREALRRCDALGAAAAVQRTRRRMREIGMTSIPVGVRSTTRENPARLTRREHEVLELLHAGKTNAEIADELVLSPKTVDQHVSAVLAKLAVPNRYAAASKASRLGLIRTATA